MYTQMDKSPWHKLSVLRPVEIKKILTVMNAVLIASIVVSVDDSSNPFELILKSSRLEQTTSEANLGMTISFSPI